MTVEQFTTTLKNADSCGYSKLLAIISRALENDLYVLRAELLENIPKEFDVLSTFMSEVNVIIYSIFPTYLSIK